MKKLLIGVIAVIAFSFACQSFAKASASDQVAIFASGCFWCAQADFNKVRGVENTIAGYTGGNEANPTYEEVSSGETHHYEALEVYYDPTVVSYAELVNYFWHNVDPTNPSGQFCDNGDQYRSVIFYSNEKQKAIAEASMQQLLKSGKFSEIVTKILPAKTFYPAEEYHQNYYQKNPLRYALYRYTCGRDKRLKQIWGDEG